MHTARRTPLVVLLMTVVSITTALDNGLGLTPPMGWSTWCTDNGIIPCENDFCNEAEVMSIAEAMQINGMQALGYEYLNLDDCWAGPRDANGTITADTSRFPSGSLEPLANFLHSKGFKLGLYTDVGNYTCRDNRPGSWGHYRQDAETYASWGIDFVKMDWCDHPSQYNASQLYGMMRDALNATGRPMFFAICEWGLYEPWTWGPSTGNSWRVGPDHLPVWWTPKTNQDPGQGQGTANIIQHMAGLGQYAKPGAWNDPDFLMTGEWTEGIFYPNQRNYQVLFNSEAIAVNQDVLGIGGDLTFTQKNGGQVWAKPLDNNQWAVILYNSRLVGTHEVTITLTIGGEQLPGWPAGSTTASVRDIWAHKDLGTFNGKFVSPPLQPHASTMYILTPAQ